MERRDDSERGNAEPYVIQGSENNPVQNTTPPLGQFETMDSEGAPKFIYDQGIYYPTATHFSGFYCTGFESPGDWNDQRFFGLDGPEFQHVGAQSENISYVHYTPTYGYAQSPYNPYNPCIPGAIFGVDGSVVGTQQYYPAPGYQHTVSAPSYPHTLSSPIYPHTSAPSYQQTVPAPAYYPLVAQPSPDHFLIRSQEPHHLDPGTSDVNGQGSIDTKLSEGYVYSQFFPSDVNHGGVISNEPVSRQPTEFTSGPSDGIPHSASSHISQGKSVGGSTQGSDQFLLENVAYSRANLNGGGWAMDKPRSRLQFGGASRNGNSGMDSRLQFGVTSRNGNGGMDSMGEHNRGPRTNRSKGQTSAASVEAHNMNIEATNLPGNIVIHTDQYNREDFPINYADAKFFVIKSYSEDDVHKSIKYNVWSSTPNGNKRLDYAYEDAQKIAADKQRGCPVFLFFSVNASGQFCGVAEMVGPVDFNKDMDFWQQDKWSGSFPVKWHMIKDVPNSYFRQILLENNDNKPVTNSRDTQEIKCIPGLEMLKIFKNYTVTTSILDDFKYYEERQRTMQEEKSRRLGKSYDASLFTPAFVLGMVPPSNGMSEKIDPRNPGKTAMSSTVQVPSESDEVDLSVTQKEETSILKIGSLTIHPKPAEANSSAAVSHPKTIDVVTVGSTPINDNGSTEAPSEVITIGTIPIVPKAELDKPV